MAPAKRSNNNKKAVDDGPCKQRRMDAFVQRSPRTDVLKSANSPSLLTVADGSKLFDQLIDADWRRVLAAEFGKDYFKKMEAFLDQQWTSCNKVIYPEKRNIFAALNTTSLKQVKVVIIGQDPYHGQNQAHGYSFSVPPGVPPPPSLRNIYKELATDIEGFSVPKHGCLIPWAKEGVLLLNATLTVERHQANSHSQIGWQTFTNVVIKTINDHCFGVVFLLWGAFAQQKESLISLDKHSVIKAAHPSPFSQTKFFGCKCFSRTNDALKLYERGPINWHLPNAIN